MCITPLSRSVYVVNNSYIILKYTANTTKETYKLKPPFFGESASLLDTTRQRSVSNVIKHQKCFVWPFLSTCYFLVLFVYPCATSLRIALWFTWKFSCVIIFHRVSINIIVETIPIFFHQIYNLNIVQTKYYAMLSIIHCGIATTIKCIEKMDFQFQFVQNLVVIRYLSKKSIVNMNDLNHDSNEPCQSPSVFC